MKFIGYASTNIVGSQVEEEFEIDDEELEGLEPGSLEYDKVVESAYQDVLSELIEMWWEPVEDE